MNKFISGAYNKLRNEVMYSPLAEDAEIFESSPNKISTPSRNSTFWRSSRRLFQSNRSFKINKKNSDNVKKGRIRKLIEEFQTKVQTWSEEIRNNFHRGPTKNKTPNCVTPNRKIRYMLGRTPEKLYSPFGIETPTNFKWHKFHDSNDDPLAHFYGWVTPKRNFKSRKLRV